MAITESDTTVGGIVNEVGARLAEMLTTADKWGYATVEALEQTPGSSAPQPADPSIVLPSAPSGSDWSAVGAAPTRPNVNFTDPQEPSSYRLRTIDAFDAPSGPVDRKSVV